jgi:response regulator of citrate/malate metabolism
MQYGAFDYIMKPVHLDDLSEKLNQAFQRKLILEERLKVQGERGPRGSVHGNRTESIEI